MPTRELWLPVHRHIWDIRSPYTPWTWTLIPWWIQSSIVRSCSSNIYVVLWLLFLINSYLPLYIAKRCVASCVLPRNALKSLIIASWCFPSQWFWGPMNLGFAYGSKPRGASSSAPEGGTCKAGALFSWCWARALGLSSLISKQGMWRWKMITCGR